MSLVMPHTLDPGRSQNSQDPLSMDAAVLFLGMLQGLSEVSGGSYGYLDMIILITVY